MARLLYRECEECRQEYAIADHHFCPMHPDDNAFTYGQRIKEVERKCSEVRIARALKGDTIFKPDEQRTIAMCLYEAKYDNHDYQKEPQEWPNANEILEALCWRVFGATFNEVMKAWDKFLG